MCRMQSKPIYSRRLIKQHLKKLEKRIKCDVNVVVFILAPCGKRNSFWRTWKAMQQYGMHTTYIHICTCTYIHTYTHMHTHEGITISSLFKLCCMYNRLLILKIRNGIHAMHKHANVSKNMYRHRHIHMTKNWEMLKLLKDCMCIVLVTAITFFGTFPVI